MIARRIPAFSLLIVLLFLGFAVFSTPEGAAQTDSEAERILHLNNRGVAFLDQYKFKEAVEEFEQIIAIDPGVMPAHANLGIAFFYDQKYEAAIESFQNALELEPREIRSHYVLGLIYRNQDEVRKAIEAFQVVHEQDPDDPSTNYYLGRLLMRNREYQKAAVYFEQVISEEPYNASAHYNLATALSRSGKREEGRREMEEFKRLQGLFGSTTVGLQYLEQGKYAIAIDNIPADYLRGYEPPDQSDIQVTFRSVTDEAGLDFVHGGPGEASLQIKSRDQFEQQLVPYLGSGIGFADYDQDGWLDVYIASAGKGQGALFRNRGDGTFGETTGDTDLGEEQQTMHLSWGDFNDDGYPDLYLINYGSNRLLENQQDGTFLDVTRSTGTGDDGFGLGGSFLDFDHDGDLDIFVNNFVEVPSGDWEEMRFPEDFSPSENVLLRNNGDGTFTDVAEESHLAAKDVRTISLVSSDLNNSRDVDFLLLNSGASPLLLNNMRDGTFVPVEATTLKALGQALSAGVGDLDNDGWVDLGIISKGPGESRILMNEGNNRFSVRALPSGIADQPLLNVQFFDYDNDSDLDILLLATSLLEEKRMSRQQNLFLLENREGDLHDVSSSTGLSQIVGQPVRGSTIVDYDRDGDLDLAINVNGAAPLLLRNEGGNQNNWLSIIPVGTNSNRSGVASKAEVKAGRMWQKREFFGAQGFLTHSNPLLHFGLGRFESADVVRILWPNGVLQSEIDRAANEVAAIQELDRKGTSCPILYVWDGETYRFQTDFLGGSAYGSLLRPGLYNRPDTDEYVKLNRSDVAVEDDQVKITMNNQLEEVILFDHLELVVVDHPAEYEVFPDEKLLPGPPYNDFHLFSAEKMHFPIRAVDGRGNSILDRLKEIDRVYPEVADSLPFKGYTDLHEIVLDLGDVSDDYAVLLMHAWIDYADSTSNLAASQAGIDLVPPYLQVRDESGRWVTVIERMGFPAGLPKTMTVDLSGRFLSDSREVRIITNMKIYWDQISVATGWQREDYRLHRLGAAEADLRYRGFPEVVTPDGQKPKVYSYDGDSFPEWKVHVGAYTRFGEVSPLLETRDDMFVITRSGDEVRVRFDLSALPKPPAGWVRDYLVYVDGFGKDMDPNSAAPHFLGPLPHHEMSAFPYSEGEGYPDSPAHREYLEKWNTRIYEDAVPGLRSRPAEE